jgi:hypothetical protein
VEDTQESLSAIVGVRSELAAGDLRPLYLAWLSGYGVWERDKDAFGEEDEDEMEPSVPGGLGSLTAPQRALADFLRLDSDLLEVAAETSAALPTVTGDARVLARHIAKLLPAVTPVSSTVPENQRLAGLRSQSSVSGASGGPLSIQAWIA